MRVRPHSKEGDGVSPPYHLGVRYAERAVSGARSTAHRRGQRPIKTHYKDNSPRVSHNSPCGAPQSVWVRSCHINQAQRFEPARGFGDTQQSPQAPIPRCEGGNVSWEKEYKPCALALLLQQNVWGSRGKNILLPTFLRADPRADERIDLGGMRGKITWEKICTAMGWSGKIVLKKSTWEVDLVLTLKVRTV